MNSDLQHYNNKTKLNLKILNSIAFYLLCNTSFCRTSSSRAILAFSFPQNHQALSVTGCQQRLVVVEADAKYWTGMPLELVEARTTIISNVEKVHAAVFTPTN
jgi:hypothetical protein